MARKVLYTTISPVYNAVGQHTHNRIDTYFVDTPATAPRLRTTRAPAPRLQTPQERLRTMSDAERR